MRIESRKHITGTRTPRRRVDATGHVSITGLSYSHAPNGGGALSVSTSVLAGSKQEERHMRITFNDTETAAISGFLARVASAHAGTVAEELAELRAMRDDVAAYVSDYRHGLGPDIRRLLPRVQS